MINDAALFSYLAYAPPKQISSTYLRVGASGPSPRQLYRPLNIVRLGDSPCGPLHCS